jgi:acetate kinase
MIMAPDSNILTINSSSASIKFALYRMGRDEKDIACFDTAFHRTMPAIQHIDIVFNIFAIFGRGIIPG